MTLSSKLLYNYVTYMKVYFNASLTGKLHYYAEYRKIISLAQQLGHTLYADHVMKRDFGSVNKQKLTQHQRDFQKAREAIKEIDVVITEATYPSVGIGYLVGLALEMYKPVLILYLNSPHGLLLGDPNRLLTLKKYDLRDEKKLKKFIKSFIDKSQNKILKYKFNLMLSKNHTDLLEFTARKERMSKAQFIRNLIDKEIKKKNNLHL